MFLSKYGVARVIEIPIIKRGVVDFAVGADWTAAAGDVKIIKDGGAATNVTNLPAAIASGNGAVWSFSLTATEMQAARVVVTVVDASTKAVEDQSFIIETYGHASAQHEIDLDQPQLDANVTKVAGTVQTSGDLKASLDIIDDLIDTEMAAVLIAVDSEIAAIKAVTDLLPNGGALSNLDAAVSSRLASAGYTAPPSVGAIADQVWDEAIAGHLVAGSTGEKLNSAGAAGDPWGTALPGAYVNGTAGFLLGTNLNGKVGDLITPPSDISSDADARSSVPKMIKHIFNRWYNEVDQTKSQQRVKNDAGNVVSTMPISDSSGVQTKGKAI